MGWDCGAIFGTSTDWLGWLADSHSYIHTGSTLLITTPPPSLPGGALLHGVPLLHRALLLHGKGPLFVVVFACLRSFMCVCMYVYTSALDRLGGCRSTIHTHTLSPIHPPHTTPTGSLPHPIPPTDQSHHTPPQEIVDHMYVNSSRDGRILFNFNITFPSVSCSLLSADAMDPLGNKQASKCTCTWRVGGCVGVGGWGEGDWLSITCAAYPSPKA